MGYVFSDGFYSYTRYRGWLCTLGVGFGAKESRGAPRDGLSVLILAFRCPSIIRKWYYVRSASSEEFALRMCFSPLVNSGQLALDLI